MAAAHSDSTIQPERDGENGPIVVSALYLFTPLPDFREIREQFLVYFKEIGLRGSILLAEEGINGTVAGTREVMDIALAKLRSDPRLAGLEHKESYCDSIPFNKMKVKLKREIVTMGVPGIDPTSTVGQYVEPTEWNELISRDDVLLVDTRNKYEVRIGTFEGAVDPQIAHFRHFPDWIDRELEQGTHKKVAMFCTGGIRCEKATSLLKERGFEDVYHLKGGILKYLEETTATESMWNGDCFVFDYRVALNHELQPAGYGLCSVCRGPVLLPEGQEADRTEVCETCLASSPDEAANPVSHPPED